MKKQLTLKLISSITSSINSTDNLEKLLDVIIATTRDVLNTEGCSLLLYDKEEDCLVFNVTKGEKHESLASLKVPRGKGIAGTVLDTLEPLIVNDPDDPRIYRNIDEKVGFQTRNLLCVPMLTQGEVQGVLEAVNSRDRDDFDSHDLKILVYLADLAAIAIRNRKLITSLENRASELDCLYQISQELSNITELDTFLDMAVKAISEVLHVKRVSLVFRDSPQEKFRVCKSVGFSLEEEDSFIENENTIIYQVIKSREPVLVENTETAEFIFPRPESYSTRSFISVPIKQDTDITGVINVADKESRESFNTMDLHIVSTISGQIAEAWNSLKRKKQEEKLSAIEKDMKVASEIQINSLPVIPKIIQSLEIETMYVACREIGGDFYDLVYHNMEEVSVLIADVSGKGIPAALFMEFSKTIISAEVSRNPSTSISLMSADRTIQENMKYFMFVSVMLVRINMRNKTLHYSSAGHNQQMLYRAGDKSVELLSGKGMPLGIKDSQITEHVVEYRSGDLLMLYTDGVTETMNPDSEVFDEDRVVEILKAHGDRPVDELLRTIRSATEEFRQNADPHDDYTMMLIRLN